MKNLFMHIQHAREQKHLGHAIFKILKLVVYQHHLKKEINILILGLAVLQKIAGPVTFLLYDLEY